MADKSASMTFLIEPDLRTQFLSLCRADHKPASQVLRALMREYIAQNAKAQGSLPLKSGGK